MKAFVIAALFVVSCSAHYGAISTQYQSQDGHGGYSYGYSDPLSSKQETKSHDGTTHGGYSYVDAHGHVQSVKYVADPHHGFQIVSATNLPKAPVHVVAAPAAYHAAPAYYAAPAVSHWGVPSYAHAHGAPLPVQKTPEVLAAEHAHFAAVAEVKARQHHHHKRSAYGYAPAPINGVPTDTAEVAHAKAAHFALVAEAKSKIGYSGHYAPAPQYNNYAHAPAHSYNHYAHQPAPAPVNGVPVDTAEVAHAKAAHFAAVAEAKSKVAYGGHYAAAPAYHSAPAAYHYPIINNGVPEDTYEVKAAKAKHFAAVHEAQAKASYAPHYDGQYENQYAGHYAGHSEDDGSYDAARYEKETYYH